MLEVGTEPPAGVASCRDETLTPTKKPSASFYYSVLWYRQTSGPLASLITGALAAQAALNKKVNCWDT